MPVQTTPTDPEQGATNAFMAVMCVLVFCFLLTKGISLFSHQPMYDSFGVALAVFWGASSLGFFGAWLSGRANAGRVLLDCGPRPLRTMSLIAAGVAVIEVVDALKKSSPSQHIYKPLLWASSAALFLISGTDRLQIRENGIWAYSSLLRWKQIGSYRWLENSTLIVRRKGLLGSSKVTLPIPAKHRQTVEGVLLEHLPAQVTVDPVLAARWPPE
jgi:hypothetical protein